MISYIVDLEMDAGLAAEYRAWLREHVAEMLALPGFLDASIFERLDPKPALRCIALQAHYRLRDRAAFENYLEKHAAHMRASGERFGAHVRASRSLLQALE